MRTTASLSLSEQKHPTVVWLTNILIFFNAPWVNITFMTSPATAELVMEVIFTCQLFNVDETGMPLNPKPLKIVCGTGSKIPVKQVLVTSLK